MSLGVTLRPDGGLPDVYVLDNGDACDLKKLEGKIRALLQARSWLKKEMALRKAETK